MAALVCLDCTAVYAADAGKCPQCGSARSRGDWEEPAAPAQRGKGAAKAAADAPTAGGGD
jgi:ribosomal protein L40E